MLFAGRPGWLPMGCLFIPSRWVRALSPQRTRETAHTAPRLINTTAVYRHTLAFSTGLPLGPAQGLYRAEVQCQNTEAA